MATDFNFNMPYRAQSVSRNPNAYHRVPRVNSERPSHSCKVFCRECFSRIFLGSTAFKIYLLIAWCIGLTAIMCFQRPTKIIKMSESDQMFTIVILLIYLISQLFGLLAAVTEIEKFFIPYLVVLAMITFTNMIFLSITACTITFNNEPWEKVEQHLELKIKPGIVLTGLLLFFIYNIQCFCSVLHLCSHFDSKRLLAAQRRREVMAHNARVYARLIAMQNEPPTVVTMNVDSPPKYSTLDTKQFSDTPPPVYGQVTISRESLLEEEKKTARRALFHDLPV